MMLDLHIHTKYSKDCNLEPGDILKAAREKGLGGIGIADHDTIRGAVETERLSKDIEVIKGAEIKTDRGEVIGYFIEEEITARDFWEVAEEIRSQGGIVCIPHPFDIFRINRLRLTRDMLKAIDCVEVFNSRCVIRRLNEKARRFAEENGLAKTAGSDAHFLSEIGTSGVMVDAVDDIRNLENIEVFGEGVSILNLLVTKVNKMLGR
jgi:hypothetical protein